MTQEELFQRSPRQLSLEREYARIARIVSIARDITRSDSVRRLTDEAVMEAANELAVMLGVAPPPDGPNFISDARSFLDSASRSDRERAITESARKFADGTSAEDINKFKFGAAKPEKKPVLTFSARDARVLVEETVAAFIDRTGGLPFTAATIQGLQNVVAHSLYGNLEITPDGRVQENLAFVAPTLIPGDADLNSTMERELDFRSDEVLNDPTLLLVGNKFKASIETAVDLGLITDRQANILDPNFTGPTSREEQRAAERWLDQLEPEIRRWDGIAQGRDRTFRSVSSGELAKMVGGTVDDSTPPPILPFGSPTIEDARAAQRAQADFESLGKGNEKAIKNFIQILAAGVGAFGEKVNLPTEVETPGLQTALNQANADMVADAKRLLSALTGTDEENGRILAAALQAEFVAPTETGDVDIDPTTGEQFVGPIGESPYVLRVRDKQGKVERKQLATDTGRSTFLKDRHFDIKELGDDEQAELLLGISGKTFSEAIEFFNENIGRFRASTAAAEAAEERAEFSPADAKGEFEEWFVLQGRNPEELDSNVRAQWANNTFRAGGIDNLLRSVALQSGAAGPLRGLTPQLTEQELVLEAIDRDQQATVEAPTLSLTQANAQFRTIAASEGLTKEQTAAVRVMYTPEIALAINEGGFSPELTEFIAGQFEPRLNELANIDAAREAFVATSGADTAAGRAAQSERFDDLFIGADAPGFGGGLTFEEGIQQRAEQLDPTRPPAFPEGFSLEPVSREVLFQAMVERGGREEAARQAEEERLSGLQRQIDTQRVRAERERLLALPGATEATVPTLRQLEERQSEFDLAFSSAKQLQTPIGASGLGRAIRRVAGDDLGLEQFLFERSGQVRSNVREQQEHLASFAIPINPATGLPERQKPNLEELAFGQFEGIARDFPGSDLALAQELRRTRPANIEAEREAERRRKLRGRGRTVVR